MVVVESRPARSLRLLCFYLRDTTGTARTRECCDQRTRTRPSRKPATPYGAASRKGEDVSRGGALRQHPMISSAHPSAKCSHALACTSVIRSSYSGSLSQREENNGLPSAASRKPTWCLALRIIAWLHTNESERFHYVETETRSQAIELGGYRDTTFRRLKNSEEKYQFRKSASAVENFLSLGSRVQSKLLQASGDAKRQLNSSSNCYKSPLIAAAKWIRLDLAKLQAIETKQDAAEMLARSA